MIFHRQLIRSDDIYVPTNIFVCLATNRFRHSYVLVYATVAVTAKIRAKLGSPQNVCCACVQFNRYLISFQLRRSDCAWDGGPEMDLLVSGAN